jgi:hypothetical protein
MTVFGPVVSAFFAEDEISQPTFLNLGAPYPDPSRFTVVIWIGARDNFPAPPEAMYAGATVCVTGLIEWYDGAPEVFASGPWDIWIP